MCARWLLFLLPVFLLAPSSLEPQDTSYIEISEEQWEKLQKLAIELDQSNERLKRALNDSSSTISELQTLLRESEKSAENLRQKYNALKASSQQVQQHWESSQKESRELRKRLESASDSLENFSKLSERLEKKVHLLRIWGVAGPILGFVVALLLF